MRWPWARQGREVDPDAVRAVESAQAKLDAAERQMQRAEIVGARAEAQGRRNHFAETWAAALRPRGV